MKTNPAAPNVISIVRILGACLLGALSVALCGISLAAEKSSGIINSAPDSSHSRVVSTARGWTIVPSPNNNSPATNELYATACAAVDDCWAVGYWNASTGYQTLTEHWDGSAWTIVPSPNKVGNNILQGVTCVSSSDCWAVGNADDPDIHQRTLVEHWDGNAWRVVPSPNRGLSSPPIDVLIGVTCQTASQCWAVGANDDVNGVGQTLIELWDGNAWTIVDSPNVYLSDTLYSVSCPSRTECWAVGDVAVNFNVQTLVEKWDGAAWSIVASPDTGTFDTLHDVSCISESNCVAVGSFGGASAIQTLVEQWDGASWSIVLSANTNSAQQNVLYGVSCSSPSTCFAAGYSVNRQNVYQTLIERWNGTSWKIMASPDSSSSEENLLNGISCVSASECWSVGYYAPGGGAPQTLIDEYAAAPQTVLNNR